MAPGELRDLLLECFRAALAAVDGRRCVEAALAGLRLEGEWHVVAVGKAAGAMALGAVELLGLRICDGIVIAKPGHVPRELARIDRLRLLEASHPEPDERSLAAGEAVATFVTGLPSTANILFLVSGGASSLVERLAEGVTLDDLRAVNAWALASGLAIREVNALRRAVSTLKGGGLASLAGSRRTLALLISDVPRDDAAVIGSGLLHVSRGPVPALPRLPAQIERIVRRGQAQGSRRVVPRVPHRIVASVRDACRAAARQGQESGLEARVSRARFAGDAARLGRRFGRAVIEGPPRTLHVWGGESTMILPAVPGYGGRNQHMALVAARVLQGAEDAALLAAGTDGIDGVTADAGAVVDGGTIERGTDAGFDAVRSLSGADSGHFLEAAGDLLHTGPTLTNVGDVVLGLRGGSRIE